MVYHIAQYHAWTRGELATRTASAGCGMPVLGPEVSGHIYTTSRYGGQVPIKLEVESVPKGSS